VISPELHLSFNTRKMDAVEAPRRFSTTSALLPKFDSTDKASQYGTVAQPGELEGVLAEGVQEGDAITYTTVGNESKLLFKYSLPLTLTYLLQARSMACHELLFAYDPNSTPLVS